jgi:hypothetical protein
MDRLHAYLYFLEGLLPAAERPEYRSVIVAGIDRVAAHLREIAPRFARSDVYAQLLRMRLFADSWGIEKLDWAAAEEEAAAAACFAFGSKEFDNGDDRFRGGFGFGVKNGKNMPFVNPVSTAFCGQALELWRQCTEGRLELDRLWLV